MDKSPMPFLDSVDDDKHTSGAEGGVCLARPWKSYWPPEVGSEVYELLRQHVPEVLTFRFDPNEPFDRPWQWWTKITPIKGVEACRATTVLSPGNNNDEADGIHHHHHQIEENPGTEQVDKIINKHSLPFVTPPQFNYLSDDPLYATAKPFHTRLPFLGQIRRTNIVAQAYSDVRIHDLSGCEDEFDLDTSAFAYLRIQVPAAISSVREWNNDVARRQYLPLMESWAKEYFKASRVHIYTYTFRCDDKTKSPASEAWASPFTRAHCDVTSNSGKRRLDLHLPDEADEIKKKGRWRMIGIWRPLTGPHQDRPLAVLDGRTLSQRDLVGADVVFPHYCDEGYELRRNPAHRWFYKRRMAVDDAIVFKLYDSHPDAAAKFCAHSAFVDPSVPDDTPQRASIEVRMIVVD
ncbi:hypothetical protein QBC44DRAFT_239156 [Cladorrhinum sp. PSN332]|nr:hypothetical protein QBC44DRAFT_239156 [Cladorrhinum sp. PSN332]